MLSAVQKFMDAVESRIAKQDQRITEQDTEIRSLRSELQTRAAPQIIEGPAGKDGKDGIDGRGIESVVVADGDLFVTYTDGVEKNLGRVSGYDGTAGKDGIPGERGADGIGRDGKDGINGRDGKDGVATIEEIRAIANDAVETRYADVVVRSIADSYQDVYKRGWTYPRGVLTTWDGSLWLSLRENQDQPGVNDSWKLVVKRGRDGRDARK